VSIKNVNLQNVQVPEQVQAAFDDAVKAGADRDRFKNEGQAYASDVIPKAQGTAARLSEEARATSPAWWRRPRAIPSASCPCTASTRRRRR
jgi:regulator of protease activity HflC (stomatin/prohibitin superfamily)